MTYEVNPGYSVVTPKQTFLPGETLELDDKEGKRLVDAGIVKESKEAAGKALNATDTIALVQQASLEDLEVIARDEKRKTVVDAIEKRRAELTELDH